MQVLKDLIFHDHNHHASNSLVKEKDKDQEVKPPVNEQGETPQDNGTKAPHIPSLHFGVSRAMGSRQYQEDEYTCIDNLSLGKGPAYFGIFDGHGSDLFSSYISSHLHTTIFNTEAFKLGNTTEAIREGILQTDKELFERFQEYGGGSTATVVVVRENRVYLGNVGDSRAVLAEEGKHGIRAIRLSRDHKPDDADEKERITKAGGIVWQGRVRGTESAINMSRALGDFAHKTPLNKADADWITSEPHIADPVTVTPAVKFIVLASDGLWDVATDEKVVQAINTMYSNGEKPDVIARHITSFCSNNPLADNSTVIIVFFDFEGRLYDQDAAGKVLISHHHSH